MEWKCDDLPEFFNVYLTSHSSNNLKIPRDFVVYMGRRKSGLAELVVGASGETWRVELVDDGTDLCFTDGWQAFVKENLIRDRDFLFFKYYGNMKFSVVIYGQSMCEKQMVKCIRGKGGISEAKVGRNRVEAVMSRNVRLKPSQPEAEPEPLILSRVKTAKRTSMSVKPFFEKCITTSNVNLHFPSAFVREHSLRYRNREKMVIRTSRNSSREVEVINHNRGIIICKGWIAFARANDIKAGDICRFELLDRLEMMVRRVFRPQEGIPQKRSKCGNVGD